MNKILKKLLMLLLLVVIVVGLFSIPVAKKGYDLYIQAVENTPIEQKVKEIQSGIGYTPFEEISPVFVEKLVKEEDRRFFSHSGFDVISFTRAIFANISTGRIAQGGSTITQQLAKNMYFTFDKQMERKVAELMVAWQLEKMYTKEEILSMYCAVAYFGQNCYGIKRASGYYYNVRPADLNEHQARQLVETLKAPSVYNPSTMN